MTTRLPVREGVMEFPFDEEDEAPKHRSRRVPLTSPWPRRPFRWVENRVLHISIPFTWNLPEVRESLGFPILDLFGDRQDIEWDTAIVGGPAVQLLPDFFDGMPNVTVGTESPGILQRINPMATRTTVGCVRKCKFCAIGTRRVEPGGYQELEDWPDLPIICDNNILAASDTHFNRVMDRLVKWKGVDFNQGLDARLMTKHHAERLGELREPIIRLALDSESKADREAWENAFQLLRAAGIPKRGVRSYCLIGWHDTPKEAWERCEWIEAHTAVPLPMWYHSLFQLQANIVTDEQRKLGWTERERSRIMRWFYRHIGQRPDFLGPHIAKIKEDS